MTPTLRLTRLLALFACASVLPACGAFEHSPPDTGPPNPAGDLTIRQTPNDTVRVGTAVRFTAVFADSLKGYEVTWDLPNPDITARKGRTVEWAGSDLPGTYYTQVSVYAGPNDGTTSLTVSTHVRP